MKKASIIKKITIESLAVMVAKGFEDINSRVTTKQDLAELEKRLDKKIDEVKREVVGLRSSVNNYLKLSDKRYLELKNEHKILARYLKVVIQKSKFVVDMKDLETILR